MSIVAPVVTNALNPVLCLLLHNLQNLVLKGCPPQKKIILLRFLDGQGEQIDLLQGFDLYVLYQVAPASSTIW